MQSITQVGNSTQNFSNHLSSWRYVLTKSCTLKSWVRIKASHWRVCNEILFMYTFQLCFMTYSYDLFMVFYYYVIQLYGIRFELTALAQVAFHLLCMSGSTSNYPQNTRNHYMLIASFTTLSGKAQTADLP